MATEYQLYIASDIDSDSLLRIVEDALGLDHFRDPEWRSERNPSLVGRSAPGFILTASAEDQISAEIRQEWLGFRPKLRLGFRMSHEHEWRDLYPRVLRATSAVLERLPDDAALIVNYDTGRLIRRGGHVTLADEPSAFYPEALAELRMRYDFGKVPVADKP